jgi:multiple sugar transport system permease protein/putative chitobiose transport system permease protein
MSGVGVTYLLLLIYGLFVVMPILIVLLSSIRPGEEIFKNMMPFTWRTLLPTQITLKAYVALFQEYHFGKVLFNSFYVATLTVAIGILINAMAGFAFGVFRFRGREILFGFVLITFMVPFEAISIPLFQIINQFKLINTYWGLILPGIANGLVVFLFRQFFKGLPVTLFESARIDGANWMTVFTKLALPLSKPAMLSAGILIFITQWGSFFYPLLVANKPEYRVIQVAIANFFTQYQTLWNLLFASVVIAAVIPIILLLPLQRYFVQAVTQSGIKE